MQYTAEIISVGTELLLGDIVNTDGAFLARQLAELGIPCYYQSVVGDNPARLTKTLQTALERSSLIILTGGLGPTCDDLTKETAAKLMGKTLVLHAPSYRRIQELLKSRGLPETDNQKKQAMLPPDAVVFENDYGTANGFAMTDETGEHMMILLPGPPRELEPLFSERVFPFLAGRTGQTLQSVNIGLFGIGEAALEDCLRPMMDAGVNPTVAPYCGEGEVRVRVTARADSSAACRSLCMETVENIRKTPYRGGTLDDLIYGVGADSMEAAAVQLLREKGLTVSMAESCTGGYVAKRLTNIPGSSAVLEGSFVTYSEKTKMQYVGVKPETLSEYSVYSREVAVEMARGAMETTGADIGIGITGVAGPLPAEVTIGGKTVTLPVGTVFVACVMGERVDIRPLSLLPGKRNPVEMREFVRRRASSHALDMLIRMAKTKPEA